MNKLKLNRLSDQRFAEKQMNNVRGGAGEGCCCCCGCQGSSSSADNAAANAAGDLYTPGCRLWKDDGSLAT